MKITLFNTLINSSFGLSFSNFSSVSSSFKKFFNQLVNIDFDEKLNTISIALIIMTSIVFIIFSFLVIRSLSDKKYAKALYHSYVPLTSMICLSFSLFLIESLKNQSVQHLNLFYLIICLILIALMIGLKLIEVIFVKNKKFSIDKKEFMSNILDTCDECGYEFKKENLTEHQGQKVCKSCLEEIKELEKE